MAVSVMSDLRNIDFPPRELRNDCIANAAAGRKIPSQSHEVALQMS
jgi:hypothetical protein